MCARSCRPPRLTVLCNTARAAQASTKNSSATTTDTTRLGTRARKSFPQRSRVAHIWAKPSPTSRGGDASAGETCGAMAAAIIERLCPSRSPVAGDKRAAGGKFQRRLAGRGPRDSNRPPSIEGRHDRSRSAYRRNAVRGCQGSQAEPAGTAHRAQCAAAQAHRRGSGARGRRPPGARHRAHRQRAGFRRRRRHWRDGRCRADRDHDPQRAAVLPGRGRVSQAGDRSDRGLRARRRARARLMRRRHRRRRRRAARPSRSEDRHPARRRRHAAPDAARRPLTRVAPADDRPHVRRAGGGGDGRRHGDGAEGRGAGARARHRRGDRDHAADLGDADQGDPQRGAQRAARDGADARTQGVSPAIRHRRPEGGHARLSRQAQTEVRRQVMTNKLLAPDLVVAVFGAGTMGRGIAQVCAQAGIRTLLSDTRDGAVKEALAAIDKGLEGQVTKGRMTAEARRDTLANLIEIKSYDEAADASLVIEAIVELAEPKRALFREMEKRIAPDAVLATNTSSLSVTEIAAGCERPARVAGLHFFNPPPVMRLVEVIGGLRTDPKLVETLTQFVRRIGKHPVVTTNTPNKNNNQTNHTNKPKTKHNKSQGIASPREVDVLMKEAAGFRIGPFELLDLVGGDVTHAVMVSIYNQYFGEPMYQPSALLATRVAGGLLGRKSGAGFYEYKNAETPSAPTIAVVPQPVPTAAWVADEDGGRDLAAVLKAN